MAVTGMPQTRPGAVDAGLEGLPPLAQRSLLVAGIVAAGCCGALASMLGAGTFAILFFGAAALGAAMWSSYAAVALLTVMLLVPIGSAGELPVRLNEIDFIYGAAVLGLLVRALRPGQTVARTPLVLATGAFVASGVVALAAGVLGAADTNVAVSHFRGLFGYAFIPLLLMTLGDQGRRRRGQLLLLLCLVGILTAGRAILSWAELNGVFQLNGILHRLAAPEGDAVSGAIPSLSGDFGYLRAVTGNFEGNTLGAFTLMLTPLAVHFAMIRGNALVRIGAAAGAVLLFMALLVSYSRGAYLGLALASIPALFVLWRRQPMTAIAVGIAGAALLIFLVNHLPGAEDRVATLGSLGQDATVQHRQLVYEEAALEIARSPVWGVGLGTDVGVSGAGADSLYLFMPLRGGLLLTASFIAVIWVAGRHVLMAWRRGALAWVDIAVLVGLWAFAAHSIVDYTLWNPKVALTVWLLVGFIMAAALEGEPETKQAKPVPALPKWSERQRSW